jgi:hypothetical protein
MVRLRAEQAYWVLLPSYSSPKSFGKLTVVERTLQAQRTERREREVLMNHLGLL